MNCSYPSFFIPTNKILVCGCFKGLEFAWPWLTVVVWYSWHDVAEAGAAFEPSIVKRMYAKNNHLVRLFARSGTAQKWDCNPEDVKVKFKIKISNNYDVIPHTRCAWLDSLELLATVTGSFFDITFDNGHISRPQQAVGRLFAASITVALIAAWSYLLFHR